MKFGNRLCRFITIALISASLIFSGCAIVGGVTGPVAGIGSCYPRVGEKVVNEVRMGNYDMALANAVAGILIVSWAAPISGFLAGISTGYEIDQRMSRELEKKESFETTSGLFDSIRRNWDHDFEDVCRTFR